LRIVLERGRGGERGGDYKEIKGRQRERREGIVVSSHEEGEEEKGGGRPTKRTQRQLELTRRQTEREAAGKRSTVRISPSVAKHDNHRQRRKRARWRSRR
jgi:hypothetical protein